MGRDGRQLGRSIGVPTANLELRRLRSPLSGVFAEAPQMHPFGNRVGRRFMGFFEYQL